MIEDSGDGAAGPLDNGYDDGDETTMLTTSEQTATESTTERTQSLANPRRLRIGRDGRPIPLPKTDED